MTHSPDDIHFMNVALAFARRGIGRVAPNPSVGCVIVKDDLIIGRGRTAEGGRPHAEAAALEQAGNQARGATAYVTLEPCALAGRAGPCAEALVQTGIKRAVIACIDPNPNVLGQGIEILKKAGIEVTFGVLEKEAQDLNRGFMLKVTEKRPFITLKIASTVDNMIAPENGSLLITGTSARRHTHFERSKHDAIMVGIGTVIADNPQLTTRLPGVEHKITRIILDNHLRIKPDCRLFTEAPEKPLLIVHKDDPNQKKTVLEAAGAKIIHNQNGLSAMLSALSAEGITRLFVEGGAKVHASFLKEKLGDRLLWYKSSRKMEGKGIPAFDGMDVSELFQLEETMVLGEDLLEIYTRKA